MAVLDQTRAISDLIVAWRRDIHQHPELGFEEFRTAQVVADNLRALGLEVATGVGKTGVVGILGEGKPVIGIRADMDALPVQEINDVPYASQTPGIMHACGHDAHTAMLLGAARILSQMPDRPEGEIRFFFQPCEEKDDEEGKSGATRMMEDGALEGVDRVIALHVASELPAGKVVIEEGFTSANVDTFFATIKGKGCHGAYPQRGVDPIFILAQVINAINGIRARRINPIRPAVVSIGSVHAGVAANVVPDNVQMNGTFRSFDDETREQLYRDIEAAFSVARALGGDYELKIVKGCPSVYNDPDVAALVRSTAQEMLGEDVILRQEPAMGGEDFSYMTRKAPGAMFLLGAKRDTVERPHHSPQFDIDESVFPIGSALLVETTLRLMRTVKA
jgi:amidohydrolase